MVKLAVLVSGGGTNLQAIVDAIANKKLEAEIITVVSDRKDAYALTRAKNAGIPAHYIPKGKEFSNKVLKKVQDADYIVLAGFLSILSADFCSQWEQKMINIHPSLLPKYGGKGMYGMRVHEAVVANKEQETGATVHWVTEIIDGGSIILQGRCNVAPTDTPEIVAEKVHEIEYEILIKALQNIIASQHISDKKIKEMKVLIIGSGGREHAIGKKLLENRTDIKLFFATGNGGTAQIGTNIELTKVADLCEFAEGHNIDLTIVGSEDLLVAGIVDAFQAKGLAIFGPHKKAAMLEGSKAFAKDFMEKYGIKTATYKTFREYKEALIYLEGISYPTVVKASGLAAGKGVVIAQNKQEAIQALRDIMEDKIFGQSGSEVVIEEYLEGVEASILSFYNGKEITPFVSAKDHKKIGEGETGLNTGGMGVIAPNPFVTPEILKSFEKDILQPTLKGLNSEKLQFAGVIFFGLMLTTKGVYLLEYNLRMGDPETQAILPLLETDLLDLTFDAMEGKPLAPKWKSQHSCCVVLVSGGYPLAYEKGHEINGIEKLKVPYFIAGATEDNGRYLTSGGRVLNVVALADTAKDARQKAYMEIEKISFEKSFYRKDIGVLKGRM